MKVLIVLSAILAAVIANPTGGAYYSAPAPVPVQTFTAQKAYSGHVAVPQFRTYSAAVPAYHSSRPFVTGNLYHSQDTLGQYNFGYSSSDGQAKTETKQVDGAVAGSFSYISPEGQNIQLAYTAGDEGFQASGNHLPQAPELPVELAQAYQEAHERLEKAHHEARVRGDVVLDDPRYDDGSYKGETYRGSNTYAARPSFVYSAPSAPTYVQTTGYRAYSAFPAKTSTYVSAPVSAPAPAPAAPAGPAPYSSSSYQANIGGVAAPAPIAPAQIAPAVAIPTFHSASTGKKSGYTSFGGY